MSQLLIINLFLYISISFSMSISLSIYHIGFVSLQRTLSNTLPSKTVLRNVLFSKAIHFLTILFIKHISLILNQYVLPLTGPIPGFWSCINTLHCQPCDRQPAECLQIASMVPGLSELQISDLLLIKKLRKFITCRCSSSLSQLIQWKKIVFKRRKEDIGK